jgi:hypothetical protein
LVHQCVFGGGWNLDVGSYGYERSNLVLLRVQYTIFSQNEILEFVFGGGWNLDVGS